MARKIFLPTATELVEQTRKATISMYAWMRDITAGVTAGGGPAPADAPYVTYAADATLTAERVATSSATVTVNLATANQIKWDAVNTGTVTHTGDLTAGQLIQGNGGADVTVNTTTATVTKLTAGVPSAATAGTDYTALAFKTISVSGQSDVVADSAADTLTLAAGANITITTDATTDTVTIAASSSGSGGSTLIGIDRLLGDGATTAFNLPDVAEYVIDTTDAGAVVDPTLYTLSADRTQVTFDSAPTAGHVLTFEYAVAQL